MEETNNGYERLIGDVLREFREHFGLTQEQVADGICEPSTLSRFETGSRLPSRHTARMLMERLGEPDFLYYGAKEMDETFAERYCVEIFDALECGDFYKAEERLDLYLTFCERDSAEAKQVAGYVMLTWEDEDRARTEREKYLHKTAGRFGESAADADFTGRFGESTKDADFTEPFHEISGDEEWTKKLLKDSVSLLLKTRPNYEELLTDMENGDAEQIVNRLPDNYALTRIESRLFNLIGIAHFRLRNYRESLTHFQILSAARNRIPFRTDLDKKERSVIRNNTAICEAELFRQKSVAVRPIEDVIDRLGAALKELETAGGMILVMKLLRTRIRLRHQFLHPRNPLQDDGADGQLLFSLHRFLRSQHPNLMPLDEFMIASGMILLY